MKSLNWALILLFFLKVFVWNLKIKKTGAPTGFRLTNSKITKPQNINFKSSYKARFVMVLNISK